MREHDQAAPPDDGGHQGSHTTPDQTVAASNVNAPPTQNIPIPRTGPSAHTPSTRQFMFSSPLIRLSLLATLAAILAYMFFGSTRDTPQSDPQEMSLQR